MTPLDGAPVVIVTGAATGIGRAVVNMLLEHRYTVVGMDLATSDEHDRLLQLQGDVRSIEACRSTCERASELGPVKGLVNNAGVERHGSVVTMDETIWNLTIDVNLNAHARMSRFAVPAMAASGGRSIVNMSSAQGLATQKKVAAYSVAKGGVIAFELDALVTNRLKIDAVADALTLPRRDPDALNAIFDLAAPTLTNSRSKV